MSYEYDVFISYKTGKIFGRWVIEVFYDFFKEYLEQSLGRQSKIFLDQSEINDGDSWPARIKRAIAKSKCLVAVLSPLYFQSEWCKKEFSAILYRENKLGLKTLQNPRGLLSAIILHDGDRFPRIIKDNIQCRSWHDYALVGKGFENTDTFIQFQVELQSFAENTALLIENAPPYSEDWLSEEWLDTPYHEYKLELVSRKQATPIL